MKHPKQRAKQCHLANSSSLSWFERETRSATVSRGALNEEAVAEASHIAAADARTIDSQCSPFPDPHYVSATNTRAGPKQAFHAKEAGRSR